MTQGVGEIGNITPGLRDYQQPQICVLQQLGHLPAQNAAGSVCAPEPVIYGSR